MGVTLFLNVMEASIGDLFLVLLIFGVSFIVVATLISKFNVQAKKNVAIRLMKQYACENNVNATVESTTQHVSLYFPPTQLEELMNHALELERLIDFKGFNCIVTFFDDESRGIYAISVDFHSHFMMPADVHPTGNTISGFKEYVKSFRIGGQTRDKDRGVVMWDGMKEGYYYKK